MDETEFMDDIASLEGQLMVMAEQLRTRTFYLRHFTPAQQALYGCNNTAKALADLRLALRH